MKASKTSSLKRLITTGGIAALMLVPGTGTVAADNPGSTQAEEAIAKGVVAAANGDTKSLEQQAINSALQEATGVAEDTMKQWLPTFELGMQANTNGKPVFDVLGLMPLHETEQDLFFTQDSLFYTDSRTTLNLGLGYRHLSDNDTVLYGVNAFYDHEFPYDHSRASIGAEIRTSVAELNMNMYQHLSEWREGRNGQIEKAMDGYDLEAGIAVPYVPAVMVYAKHFEWNADDGGTDLKGNRYSVAGDIYPGLEIELGRDYFQGSTVQDKNFVKLSLNIIELMDGASKAKPLFSDTAWTLSSMREHRYDKVRRENLIQKQTGAGSFTATVSGI